MKYLTMSQTLLLMVLLATGCTTTRTGTGFGSTASGPVAVTWTSSDSVSGAMSATLDDGATYSGNFLQVTSDTTVDGFAWGPGPLGDGTGNATHYSGRVLADLTSPDGRHVRCAFRLVHPSSGMSGGGGGLCQTPSGTIDVTLRKS